MEDKIMKQTQKNMDAFIASLLPDSDKKMGAIAGVALLVALMLCFWAAAYEVVIDDVIFEHSSNDEMKATLNVIERKEKKVEKEKKKIEDPYPSKKAGGGGKQKGQGKKHAELNKSVLKMLTAQTHNASAMTYDLVKQTFAKDIEKVLKNTSGLQTTGKTKIGELRGKVEGGFNEGYAAGGSGGIGGFFDDLRGPGAPGTSKALKGRMKAPSERDIDVGSASAGRSAADIMKVVRNRTPGLRHVYNMFLKKKRGFQGKVTLRFSIAPGGEIVSIAIVSSTTDYAEFDEAVKHAVSRWRFNKVKSGNTVVTIPFTFTE